MPGTKTLRWVDIPFDKRFDSSRLTQDPRECGAAVADENPGQEGLRYFRCGNRTGGKSLCAMHSVEGKRRRREFAERRKALHENRQEKALYVSGWL